LAVAVPLWPVRCGFTAPACLDERAPVSSTAGWRPICPAPEGQTGLFRSALPVGSSAGVD
jgi:hypothetical protein